MTADTSPWAALFAIVWFVIGAYGVGVALRHRAYINSLPPTAGNRRVKLQNRIMLLLGLAMLLVGAWNTVARFL